MEKDNGDENKVHKWIIRVDEHIDQESLEIMKLGMQSELKQIDTEKAERPSDLYHALECRYQYQEPSVCLARFIYALKRLGHRRHGHRAIEQLNYFIPEPTEFHPATYMSRNDLKMFEFLQNLVGILVSLKEKHKMQQKLIKLFAEKHLNRTNPNNIKTLCSLFTLLLQREIITADRPQALIEAMKEVSIPLRDHERYNLQSYGMYKIMS